jgi:hypothetical protein
MPSTPHMVHSWFKVVHTLKENSQKADNIYKRCNDS